MTTNPPPTQLLLKQTGPEEQERLRVEDTIFRPDVLFPFLCLTLMNRVIQLLQCSFMQLLTIRRLHDWMHPHLP